MKNNKKNKSLPGEMSSKNSPRRGISTRGLIFSLGFGYGLKTQIVKIRKKLFSTRQMAMISTLIFLAIGAGIFFSIDYFAKGATYGWVQSSWVGGADPGAVATHSTDQTGWTKYHSADDNISVDGDGNVTMTSGSQDLVDASEADFLGGVVAGCLSPDGGEVRFDPAIDRADGNKCIYNNVGSNVCLNPNENCTNVCENNGYDGLYDMSGTGVTCFTYDGMSTDYKECNCYYYY